MATEKQRRFFFVLCKELGVEDIDVAMQSFATLPVKEASARIDEMLARRREEQVFVKTESE